jgi:hypothetical protein
MPQLTSIIAPLGTAVLDFKVKSGRIIAEPATGIPRIAMPKMGLLHPVNILNGGVGDVNQLLMN